MARQLCKLLIHLCLVFSFSSSSWAKAPQSGIPVRIKFEYKNFPAKIELFSVKDDFQYSISETQVLDALEKGPTASPLPADLRVKKGESKVLAFVVRNKTDKDLYFYASPHMITPVEASVGQKFECLCNHSVFHLPIGKIWVRIARVEVGEEFQSDQLTLIHSIIGVDKKDANKKFKHAIH